MVLLLDADFPDDLPVRDPQQTEDRGGRFAKWIKVLLFTYL